MDLIILVVVILVLVSMLVLMFRYAGFIHKGPAPEDRDQTPPDAPPANSSNKESE